ncbi:MAG: sulfotransferase family protein [Gemmobacter sp.]
MADPVVMFGLGATKAGTTWLHRYLSAHPDCAMPPNKELHYFDRIESGTLARELKIVRDKRARLARDRGDAPPSRARALDRSIAALDAWADVLARGVEDAAAYRAFLTAGTGGRRVVGDITPAYALLAPETLDRMQRIAPDTRFVYLLRDPVDRLWSHLRMVAGRAGHAGPAVLPAAQAAFDTWAAGGHPEITARGDYAAILPKLGGAIRPGALFIEFYERLFEDAGVARLCSFLGIGMRKGDYARRVHEGGAAPLDAARAERARALLEPQYAAVRTYLGDLPARWTMNVTERAA